MNKLAPFLKRSGMVAGHARLLEVVADGRQSHAEQLSDPLLVEPRGLGLVEHLDAHGIVGRAVEGQLSFLRELVGHSCPSSCACRFPAVPKLFVQGPGKTSRSPLRMSASAG